MTRLLLVALALAFVLAGCDATIDPAASGGGLDKAGAGASTFESQAPTSQEYSYTGYEGMNLEFDIDTPPGVDQTHGVSIWGTRPHTSLTQDLYVRFEMRPRSDEGYDLVAYWPGVSTYEAQLCLYRGGDIENLQLDDCFDVTSDELGAVSGEVVASVSAPWDGVTGGGEGRIKSAHTSGSSGGVDYPPGPGTDPFPDFRLEAPLVEDGRASVRDGISHVFLEFHNYLTTMNDVKPNTIRVEWEPGASFQLLDQSFVEK